MVCHWSDAAGIQRHWPRLARARPNCGGDGNEARPAVGSEEAAFGEKAGHARAGVLGIGPLKWAEGVVIRLADPSTGAEVAGTAILEGGQRRIFAEDLGGLE
jgi:hypothetical protein